MNQAQGNESIIRTPSEFICPITCVVMKNPVITADGHTYEEKAIKDWFAIGKKTSPVTGLPLSTLQLTPNHTLRKAINEFEETKTQWERQETRMKEDLKTLQEKNALLIEKNKNQHSQLLRLDEESKLDRVVPYTERTNKLSYIFVGNPGAGKSTLLNAFLGRVAFKSGVSLGSGLTKILQEEYNESGNIRYIDTPGLSDIKYRKQAAEEIKKALQIGGSFKIIFVITLEGGRIRPDDLTTIKLVLDSATMINKKYSILINKVSEEVIELWNEDIEARTEFMELLNGGLPGTDHVFLNPFERSLDNKRNALLNPDPALQTFIHEKAPIIKTIPPDQVKNIQIENFEELKAILTQTMQRQQEQFDELKTVFLKQQEQIKRDHEALRNKQMQDEQEKMELRQKIEELEKVQDNSRRKSGPEINEAIQLDPNNALAYYNKGNVLRNLKEYGEAIKMYDKCLQLDPNNALAYYNKGNVLRNLKEYGEAIKMYDKSLQLDPNNADAYHNKRLALSYL